MKVCELLKHLKDAKPEDDVKVIVGNPDEEAEVALEKVEVSADGVVLRPNL
jgi:3-dehydroquinate synthase class II